jgi:hypothetical protein
MRKSWILYLIPRLGKVSEKRKKDAAVSHEEDELVLHAGEEDPPREKPSRNSFFDFAPCL